MDSGLAGKTVIVTGGSGGIGQEVVRQFIGEGANVVIHYFQGKDRADELAKEFDAETVAVIGADLREEADVARLFEESEKRFGVVDVLVANAGVWPVPDTPVQEMSLPQWNETIANNMTTVFLCVRQFLNCATRQNVVDPAVVMIGSTAGFFGEAGHGDYAASKSGLMEGLLMSLKNEMVRTCPRGRVNVVCPGWTLTSMARKLTQDSDAMVRALQTIPLKKFGRPADVASAILFFASNRLSGHVTGQSLFVSGGMEGRVLYSPDEIDLEAALP